MTPGIPVTYVPFRNANLLSAATSWAEVLGATSVFFGAMEEDSSGYPDCRGAFVEAFNRVIEVGTRGSHLQGSHLQFAHGGDVPIEDVTPGGDVPIEDVTPLRIAVVAPLLHLTKADVVRRGTTLGAPFHLTWSCYQAEDVACGRCDSCLLRERGFREAGVPDPIPYAGAEASRR